MSHRDHRGFTLLEVMVALAIVSIGLIAVFNGVIQMAHSTSMLRERALADWIAMNQISEIRISGEFPGVGSFDGRTEFAGREWHWEANVSETGVRDLRRIDMAVAYEELPGDPVTILTGFVARETASMPFRIDWWGADLQPGPGDDPDPGIDPGREDGPPETGEEDDEE